MAGNVVSSKLHETSYQKELEQVAEFVENIKAGVANYYFLNFFAPDGFGKTTLLQQIWEDYEKIFPASLVRVKRFQKVEQILCDLLIHIIRELDLRLPKRVTSLPTDYEHSTNEAQLAELVFELVSSAKKIKKAVLLLFDDYDAMPAENSHWFEGKFLSKLVQTKNVAVILTSELELRFTERIDLRMRLESYELSSFSAEAISRSFPQYEESASEIYRITGGLPTLTRKLIQQLKTSHVTTDADFRSHEQELVRKYYRTHVNETVFQGMSPDKQETILTLALLRRFDVTVLRGILPKVLPDSYQSYGTADYLDLIERLGSWVQWRLQGGYALNQAFRILLQGYVLIEKPELYEQVNRAAIVLYDDLLKKEYREHYLIELLYHRVCLLRARKDTNLPLIQTKIGDEFLKFLKGNRIASVRESELDSLRNSLKRDQDLKDYISGDVLLAIETLIKTRIEEAHVLSPLKVANK